MSIFSMHRSRLSSLLSFSVALALTVGFSLVAGCSKETEPAQPASTNPGSIATTKVTLALNWVPEPEFGGFYAAKQEGFYKQHKLDVDIKAGGAGTPVAQRVASGDVEFGIVSADEVLILRPKGADLVAIFTVFQTCPQGIMARASRNLASIEDVFKSGTVAVEPGNAYVSFLKKKYDLSKAKLVTYQGGITRFLAEEDYAQQCFVFSEPVAAKLKGVDSKVFLIADTGYNPYTAVVVVKGDYLRSNRSAVERFVQATRQGWRAYLDNPAPANEIIGKLNTALDAPTLAAAAIAQAPLIESDDTKANGLGSMTAARWQTLAEQLKDLGVVEKPPAASECFVQIGK